MLNRTPSSHLGRHVYGLGGIALGLVGLAWKDFATVWHPVPPDIPHHTALALIAAVWLIAGGLALQWRPSARAGAVMLGLFFLIPVYLWLRRVIGFPRIFGTWLGFNEQFVLVLAAVLVYAMLVRESGGAQNAPGAETTLRISRYVFGICMVIFGLAHLIYIPETAGMVPAWLPPTQRFWAIATGGAFLLGALAILSGIQAVLASRLLTAMLVGFGLLVWAPTLFVRPADHTNWGGNAVNLAMTGAFWVVADSIAGIARE